MSFPEEKGLKLRVEYDSGVVTVQIADFDKGKTVVVAWKLNEIGWPNGKVLDLSKRIDEIEWKP